MNKGIGIKLVIEISLYDDVRSEKNFKKQKCVIYDFKTPLLNLYHRSP
jgi:hypothetical protein